MTRTLDENAFVAICQAAQEYYACVDRKREWEKKPTLLKLFGRPRNPFPEIQDSRDISSYLSDALRGSIPELWGPKKDETGTDWYWCDIIIDCVRHGKDWKLVLQAILMNKNNPELNYSESYRYKKGCGFVHCGYGSPDSRGVFGVAMAPYFEKLDRFRTAIAPRIDSLPMYSRRELKKLFRDIRKDRKERENRHDRQE